MLSTAYGSRRARVPVVRDLHNLRSVRRSLLARALYRRTAAGVRGVASDRGALSRDRLPAGAGAVDSRHGGSAALLTRRARRGDPRGVQAGDVSGDRDRLAARPESGPRVAAGGLRPPPRRACRRRGCSWSARGRRARGWRRSCTISVSAARVIFTGYRDRDLPAVVGAADCFALMAAGSDDSCRAALEAMAAGRPVVARRVGALPEAVAHGSTGLLIDDDRPEAVAAALRALIDDPDRARAMGRAGAAGLSRVHPGAARGGRRGDLPRCGPRSARPVKILHLLSCRGWSSDAYWAARISAELAAAGHEVTLVCKRGTEARVIDRARRRGAGLETLGFGSGVKRARRRGSPAAAALVAVRRRRARPPGQGALARRDGQPAVGHAAAARPHAPHRAADAAPRAESVALPRATGLVLTVTEAIRQQYLAAGLMDPSASSRCRAASTRASFIRARRRGVPRAAGLPADVPLIGLVSGCA